MDIRIRDLVTNESRTYRYFDDETISDEVQSNWDEVAIIGRSAPIISYSSTGARSVSLTLHFFAETDVHREVANEIAWLQALKFPTYAGAMMYSPHMIRLIVGSFLVMDGVIESCTPSWKSPYTNDGYPMVAECSLSIKEVASTPPDYNTVKEQWYK